MITVATASVAAMSSSALPNQARLEQLSHEAGALRQELLRARKSGATSSETVDQVTRQLHGVQTQIERVVLTMQLARLGRGSAAGAQAPADAQATGTASVPKAAKTGAKAPARADAKAQARTAEVKAGAAPESGSAKTAAAQAAAGRDPYQPASSPAGRLLDVRS
ncbi:MAG: hypothetical protein KGI90_06915 [Burkholderiales bacterium]|nr:hypothetical protein [Burkholderiales bacterium]MDE2276974.1 hypothetical protein [Burkholderiales bacterium]